MKITLKLIFFALRVNFLDTLQFYIKNLYYFCTNFVDRPKLYTTRINKLNKHNFLKNTITMKKFTTLLLALLLVIPAMAHNLAVNSKMYFAKPDDWAGAQFMVGHSSWSEGYLMTKISNTKLYYYNSIKWDGYTEWIVFEQTTKWGGEGNNISHRSQWMGKQTKKGTSALGTCNLINENGTFTALTSYTTLNHPQTVVVDGEGTISMSSYELSGNNSAKASSGETSVNAAYTATVKCTATPADGYQFVGWYNGETLLSNNATYSYTAENVAKTITAKFQKLEAETPVIKNFTASATNVAAGETVTFSCDVENGEVADVVYTVNGEAIVDNTWTPDAVGTYTIAATLEGAVSQTLEVVVFVKPTIGADELAVFFDNTESQWSIVNAYVWGGGDNSNGWPGDAMTYLGNNIYKYTCTEAFTPTMVIFNNKVGDSGQQTADLNWVNGGIYTATSNVPIDVLLPEGIIELVITPADVYTGEEVTFNAYFDAEYYEGYELTFEINGVSQTATTWTPENAGDYTIVAVLTQGEDEARSEEVAVSVKEATVFYAYLMKEGAWDPSYIYYWGDAGNTWPGTQLTETETIDGVEYYKTTFHNVETVSIIFNGGDGKAQTSNIEGVTSTKYYRITNQNGGEGSYEASETPFVVEQPETLVFTVTVPVGTENCYIVGNFTGSGDGWTSPLAMTAISDIQYTITIENLVKSDVRYKYLTNAEANADDIWKNVEVADDQDTDVADRTYKENDVVYKWKGINLYCEENILCETLWYLDANNIWNADNAWFAAYFFNKNTGANTWVKGELLETGYYTFYLSQYNVPENAVARAKAEDAPVYTHVIFCRMNPAFDVMAWDETEEVENGDGSKTTNVTVDRVWNQTADLTYNGTESNALSTFQITDADGNGTWINLPTAIESVEAANGIGYAYGIVSAEGAIEVYNIGGVVVACGNDNVDLRGLNGGIYIVRNGNNVRKVVR